MKKKIIIIALIAALVVMFSFPASLFATGITYQITVVKTATGFGSGNFEFELQRWNTSSDNWEKVDTDTIGSGGGNVTLTWGDPFWYWFSQRDFYVKESGTNGATGVAWSLSSGPSATEGVVNDTTNQFIVQRNNPTKTVYFDNIKFVPSPGVSLTKTVDPTSANVGDTVNYTIAVVNIGNVDLTNVIITDPMLDLGNGVGVGLNIGTLSKGATNTLTPIPYVIPDADPNPLENTANVGTDQEVVEKASASVIVTVPPITPPPAGTAVYNITASADAGGSITDPGAFNINVGAQKIYTMTPDPGFVVADVSVNGVSVGAVTSYLITGIAANQTIHVTFSSPPAGEIVVAGITEEAAEEVIEVAGIQELPRTGNNMLFYVIGFALMAIGVAFGSFFIPKALRKREN